MWWVYLCLVYHNPLFYKWSWNKWKKWGCQLITVYPILMCDLCRWLPWSHHHWWHHDFIIIESLTISVSWHNCQHWLKSKMLWVDNCLSLFDVWHIYTNGMISVSLLAQQCQYHNIITHCQHHSVIVGIGQKMTLSIDKWLSAFDVWSMYMTCMMSPVASIICIRRGCQSVMAYPVVMFDLCRW